LKRIRVVSNAENYPSEDLQRLRSIFKGKGYDVDYHECVLLWERFSGYYESQWLSMSRYTNEQIFNNLYDFWIEVKE